jgi:hypothetical protein
MPLRPRRSFVTETPVPPAPEPASPEIPHGLLAHFRDWFSRDVAPDLADVKAVAGKVREAAPHLRTLADLTVTLARADPGIPAEVVTAAEGAAVVIARVAAELAPFAGI